MCLTMFSFCTARTRSQSSLYGPQGQIKTRQETIDVGKDNVPAGRTWYWAGFNQPGKDLFTLEKPPDGSNLPKAQATASLEHGIDERTSVGVLARMMLIGDQRLTFVEGSVRRSVGSALVEVSAAREFERRARRPRPDPGQVRPRERQRRGASCERFSFAGTRARRACASCALALDAPLKLGRSVFPAHADVHLTDRRDGTKQLDAAARLSANFDRFNLGAEARYQRQYLQVGEGRRRASSASA